LVDAAYEAHLMSVPEDTKPTRTRFSIMNEVIQKAWAEETEEVKKIVEEYHQKPKEEQSGGSQDREARNQSYQRYGFGSMTEFSKEY
jgi:hypothetical protein